MYLSGKLKIKKWRRIDTYKCETKPINETLVPVNGIENWFNKYNITFADTMC